MMDKEPQLVKEDRRMGSTFPRGFSKEKVFYPLRHAGSLVTLHYGKALTEKNRVAGDVPVYGTNGQCGWHNEPLIEGPSIVLGRKGMGPLGVEWCEEPLWVIDTAYFVTPKTNKLDLKFFYYLIKYIGLNHLKDGTSNPSLSRETFYTQLLPYPTPKEQKDISAILSALDHKIELNRQMNETLEAMARALFKSWFVDFDPVRARAEGRAPEGIDAETAALFPDNFKVTELGEIPKGWNVGSFYNTVEILSGGTPKTSMPEYWGGQIPWFSVVDAPASSDVFVIDTEKRITQAGVENSPTQLLPYGTTIVSARGTVGKCALVAVPMAMNQSCYGVRGQEGKGQYYTYFTLRNSVSTLQTHTHGSVFDTITRDTFKNISVIVPPDELTQRFDEVTSPLMEKILLNLKQSQTLAAIRDALLPKLMSGEIRVNP